MVRDVELDKTNGRHLFPQLLLKSLQIKMHRLEGRFSSIFSGKNIFKPRQLCSEDMYQGNGEWGNFKPKDGMYVNKLSGGDGLEAAAMAEYH